MKLKLSVMLLFAGLGSAAAGQQSEFAIGRTYYREAQFKEAAAHLQLALAANPDDAAACYWIGMSYQMMADIAVPFDRSYNLKARVYLTKATELEPTRPDYRSELFNFLLDSAGSSRAARRQAEGILRTVSESDPEYTSMHRRFEQQSRANSDADARLGRLFLAVPRAAYRIAEVPASALSSRSGPALAAAMR
jgi:tetratricopeptide (TPR) repeat protein